MPKKEKQLGFNGEKDVTFYLVDVPGADRVYVWHHMSPEYADKLLKQDEKTRIYRLDLTLPARDAFHRQVTIANVYEK